MFAKKFLTSLAVCLALSWALSGYYPLGFEIGPARGEFEPIKFIATVVQISALLICGIGGLLASAYCFYTYTGWQTGDGMASESLTAERMKEAPWAAPFAMLWLSSWIVQPWVTYANENTSFLIPAIMTIIFGTCLLVVIRGTFVQLFPSRKIQKI